MGSWAPESPSFPDIGSKKAAWQPEKTGSSIGRSIRVELSTMDIKIFPSLLFPPAGIYVAKACILQLENHRRSLVPTAIPKSDRPVGRLGYWSHGGYAEMSTTPLTMPNSVFRLGSKKLTVND